MWHQKKKIEALEQQIRQKLATAMNSSEIKSKHEELLAEIALESNGSLKNDDPKEGTPKNDESRVEINLGANRSFT